MKYVFSFLINWRTSVVIQHSDLNSRRDKAVCGKQCKTGSAIRHLCLNRGRMTRVGSRKYLQLIFQKSNSCCVRCPALRIMVHHLTTEGHCSNRRCRILEGCCMIQSLCSLFVFILSFSSDSGHTWYLSRTPRTCSCKFFWPGVYFVVIYAFFRCKFYSPKILFV